MANLAQDNSILNCNDIDKSSSRPSNNTNHPELKSFEHWDVAQGRQLGYRCTCDRTKAMPVAIKPQMTVPAELNNGSVPMTDASTSTEEDLGMPLRTLYSRK